MFTKNWLESVPEALSLDISRELATSHARKGGLIGRRIAELIRANDLRALCEFELPEPTDKVWREPEPEPMTESEIEQENDAFLNDDVPTVCDCLDDDPIEDLELGRRLVSSSRDELAAEMYYNCRQAMAFFSKLESLDLGIDRKKVAFDKFLEAERLCKETNDLFRKVRVGSCSLSSRVSSVIYMAQRKIARILGKVPVIGELDLRFGPGATRGVKRIDACSLTKIGEAPSCSEDLTGLLPSLLGELPHIVECHQSTERYDIFEGYYDVMASVDVQIQTSKLSFVPKNFKTFRSICVEPSLNTMIQAGIGQYMADRLRKFGVDIRDQTRNQILARTGSLTGALATLDLSMASDTVSLELCAELLPPEWFDFLKKCRSANVTVQNPLKGSKPYVIRQEKFSSMGNGFTFPLETLIFYALVVSAVEAERVASTDVSVYGDDIIVPSQTYKAVTEVLSVCGFVVNLSKSYCEGPFRESCGADWYRGIDVRPFYSKEYWSPRTLFVLHNYYVRRNRSEMAHRVLAYIPVGFQIYGPDNFGDGHLLGDWTPIRKEKHRQLGYGGYTFKTYKPLGNERKLDGIGAFAVPLYDTYRKARKGSTSPVKAVWTKVPFRFNLNELWEELVLANTPLNEKEGDKWLALPGVSGYKLVSIYTFGDM